MGMANDGEGRLSCSGNGDEPASIKDWRVGAGLSCSCLGLVGGTTTYYPWFVELCYVESTGKNDAVWGRVPQNRLKSQKSTVSCLGLGGTNHLECPHDFASSVEIVAERNLHKNMEIDSVQGKSSETMCFDK